jgi:hypothetical protein
MSTIRRPLNQQAVRSADEEFYTRHPEMLNADGTRRPLDATGSSHAGMRQEWRELYLARGGQVEEDEPAGDPDDPVQSCPLRGGATSSGTTTSDTESALAEEAPRPTLTVRWSKAEVTPDHNSTWPPASAPTDTVPEEAKVKLIGETTNVPDGTAASITVHYCETGTQVPHTGFPNLLVHGGKVVDPNSGREPELVFDARNAMWQPWKVPYYYFACTVDHGGLARETPRDYRANAAGCLRLKYWHVCTAESSTLSGVLPECNTVSGILNAVAHSQSTVQNLTVVNIPLARLGSLLRNTYAFHMASHGNALKRSDNSAIPADDPGNDYNPTEWRSVVHITPNPRFGDVQIGLAASVPSTPRYLFYASTCLTGWEPSFADAMVARGTRNVIAFRRTIPDSEAPQMARKFYDCWARSNRLDPEKIPDCFLKAGADHYSNMKPILYGAGATTIRGGSGLSPLAVAAIVVGAIAVGALIGYSIYSALKR